MEATLCVVRGRGDGGADRPPGGSPRPARSPLQPQPGAPRWRHPQGSGLLRKRVEKGKLAAADCEAALERVQTTTDLATAAGGASVIIETVAEDRGFTIPS